MFHFKTFLAANGYKVQHPRNTYMYIILCVKHKVSENEEHISGNGIPEIIYNMHTIVILY